MARTMRAAQYDKANKRILVHNIPIPTPGHNELLVKITAASLCHSDLMLSLRPDSIKRPITIGHEGVGIIAGFHSSVETAQRQQRDNNPLLQIGDPIGLFYIHDCCFTCPGCTIHGTFCTHPTNGGAKIQGLQKDGFFAEYAVIDWRNAVKLPTNTKDNPLPIERMSPFFCAGVTAFHAIDKCTLQPNQWVAVVGCGGLGQLAIRYAKAMGLRVVAIDTNDAVLRMLSSPETTTATTKDATMVTSQPDAVFNPTTTQTLPRQIRTLTHPQRGVAAACVFSDSPAAYTTAQRILTFGGTLMVVGMPLQDLKFSPMALSLGLFKVKGASNGTVAEVARALEFTVRHKIVPDVEFRRLEEMEGMWEEMQGGRGSGRRMVVRFDGGGEGEGEAGRNSKL